MIITTTETVADQRIGKVLGLVRGTTIRARHIGRDVIAAMRNVTGGEIISCGWYNTVRGSEGGGMSDLRFKRAVNDAMDAIQPTVLWYEEPIARGGKGREVIAGQAAILRVIALEREVAVHVVGSERPALVYSMITLYQPPLG